jgi:hypothetical protein
VQAKEIRTPYGIFPTMRREYARQAIKERFKVMFVSPLASFEDTPAVFSK